MFKICCYTYDLITKSVGTNLHLQIQKQQFGGAKIVNLNRNLGHIETTG